MASAAELDSFGCAGIERADSALDPYSIALVAVARFGLMECPAPGCGKPFLPPAGARLSASARRVCPACADDLTEAWQQGRRWKGNFWEPIPIPQPCVVCHEIVMWPRTAQPTCDDCAGKHPRQHPSRWTTYHYRLDEDTSGDLGYKWWEENTDHL